MSQVIGEDPIAVRAKIKEMNIYDGILHEEAAIPEILRREIENINNQNGRTVYRI